MRTIPWLVPLFLLAVAPAWGQRTMTIVSSDPADSSIEAETVDDFHPKSWVTISPLPMLLGYRAMKFPPYGRVVYYREMGYLTDLGAGMELSLKAMRLHTQPRPMRRTISIILISDEQ